MKRTAETSNLKFSRSLYHATKRQLRVEVKPLKKKTTTFIMVFQNFGCMYVVHRQEASSVKREECRRAYFTQQTDVFSHHHSLPWTKHSSPAHARFRIESYASMYTMVIPGYLCVAKTVEHRRHFGHTTFFYLWYTRAADTERTQEHTTSKRSIKVKTPTSYIPIPSNSSDGPVEALRSSGNVNEFYSQFSLEQRDCLLAR